MLQLGLITNTVLIHPSAQDLTLVGHAQQVLRWDQRSWPVLCPPRDPLASTLFITAILLIQLEPEERSETLDKRFSAMRTVHVRASKAKGPSIRPSITAQMHKCWITMEKPNGLTGQKRWGEDGQRRHSFFLFFFLKEGFHWTPAVWHRVNQLRRLSDCQWRDFHWHSNTLGKQWRISKSIASL